MEVFVIEDEKKNYIYKTIIYKILYKLKQNTKYTLNYAKY